MKKQHAIDHFKGVPKLAAALGISRHAIYQWDDEVPEGRDYQLEVLTHGHLQARGKPEPKKSRKRTS
jgi:hypothetical protein